MKTIITVLFLSCAAIFWSQTTGIVIPLANTLYESSGLLHLNGKIITHNDSGGEAALFEIDTLSGNFSRKVVVQNATNVDWEDIAIDSTYIYIGDFGNNNGGRTNLKIYRILINEYENTINDTVSAETISFNYNDQLDFTPSQFSTNFDAEAMIAFNDTLYVFTKNWGNQKSNIYAIPNSIGNHTGLKIDSLNPQGLITGATYDPISKSLVLIGYLTSPFIFTSTNLTPPYFSSNNFSKTTLSVQNSIQIEGVTSIGSNYYLTAEQNQSGVATLYRLNYSNSLKVDENEPIKIMLFPNPVYDILTIELDAEDLEIFIYNVMGTLVLKTSNSQIDCSSLLSGMYIVKCISRDRGEVFFSERIIKK